MYFWPKECTLPLISSSECDCFWCANAAPSVRNDPALPHRQARLAREKIIHQPLNSPPSPKPVGCQRLRVRSLAGMAAGQFIEARDLRKTYHVGKIEVQALRGISFGVQKGEFVSVVGPSGSGKSTLFYLLGGLTRADSGSVVLDGDDFAALSDSERTRMRKRKIGFVFQKFNLLPTLDARSNIAIAQEISGNAGGDPAHFNRITDLLGLTKRLRHRPAELSGGEQQRVALARALINKPAVVLADEPTGNLDSKNSEIVLGMLRQSNQELGQTVLMITHNPEAAKYGDRIIHMRDGQIVGPEDDPQWALH